MTTPSLFTLTNQYLQLANTLADGDFDADTVADTIEASGISDDIATKCQGIEYVARSAETYIPAIDAEIARLTALKTHRVKVAAGLRDYLMDSMQRMQIERIDCPMFSISIRSNPPSVDVFDQLQVPIGYMITPLPPPDRPDKALIKEALKAGKDVPGARLTQGQRLVIK
jgi:hypothetical protein